METTTHPEETGVRSALLRDVIIGMSDGLTVPFALAAGLSAAVNSSSIIVLAGLAEVAAGSIAMALGGYFSGRDELEHHHHGDTNEHLHPEKKHEDTKDFFARLGLSEELQSLATEEIARDRDKWDEFMRQHDAASIITDIRRAKRSALNIGISYIAGGLVPLSPYFFTDDITTALKFSVAITLFTLFVFGWFRSRLTGMYPLWGALRSLLIGAAAAAAAFGVARIFETASQ
jgi:VIT1/CCC1 family predicted Fe2+/Mn2+ transporter